MIDYMQYNAGQKQHYQTILHAFHFYKSINTSYEYWYECINIRVKKRKIEIQRYKKQDSEVKLMNNFIKFAIGKIVLFLYTTGSIITNKLMHVLITFK